MGLTAADILGAKDRKIVAVDVPEWGGTVHVRSLSTAEAFALEQVMRPFEERSDIMACQLAAFVCDESGAPLFATYKDALPILARSPATLRRVVTAGMTVNGMGSLEDAKEK
ncbi:MAG TPA: hypothetical protein VGL45_09970 [Bradyrhizobium sp.]|jgi:hypothetical protein